jgi:predicted O-methyltransferase YrrM
MEISWLISQYIKWFLKAKNRHGVHSPFMYHFNEECLNKIYPLHIFEEIERERSILLKNQNLLTFHDPGAGSRRKGRTKGKVTREIRTIARNSLQKVRHCIFFYSLAKYLEARNILELGTSFGITTAYMAKSGAETDTIEGAAPVADIASGIFNKLNYTNVNLHRGIFDEIIPLIKKNNKIYDLVFIDGDHRGHALLKHFEVIVKQISPTGVIVIDDIRWSKSMYEAWKTIIELEEVVVSVDLFSMGLLFFRPGMSREKFYLRFNK